MKREKAEEEALERTYPELNLEKWSIWQPANSRHKQMKLVIERGAAQVKISANSEYGPLNTEDQKVYYALIDLFWKRVQQEESPSTAKTYISTRDLARVLKKKWNGKVAKVLADSLYRLRFTAFVWQNSYYDSTTKQTVTLLDTFTILSDLKVAKTEADGKVNKEVGHFSFYDLIAQNLLNGHTKPLLLETVLNFKSELAQMLYHHLDLVMSDKNHYERRTEALFFDDLQLKGEAYKNLSDRKRKLEKALPELKGIRLTTGVLAAVKLEQTKDNKDYKLVCNKMASNATTRAKTQDTLKDQTQEVRKSTKPKTKASKETPSKSSTKENPTDSTPTLTAEPQEPEPAFSLVEHFHKLARNLSNYKPSSKEIAQAEALIAEYGIDKAKFIVTFAVEDAQKTKFRVRTFGAVLQYVSDALAEYGRQVAEQSRQRAQEATERRQQEEIIAEQEARLKSLPESQYSALYEKVKAQVLSDYTWLRAPGAETLLQSRIREEMLYQLQKQGDS